MIKIPLRGKYGKGKCALVDDDIYLKIKDYKWFLSQKRPSGHQYIRTRIGDNSDIRLHRFIMNAPADKWVDHINGDTLDNRKSNLRFCTNQQNQWNSNKHKDKMKINGINVPKGIIFDKSRPNKPWVGRISHNKKRISTKGFSTIEEAIEAYTKLSQEYYGEFTRIVL